MAKPNNERPDLSGLSEEAAFLAESLLPNAASAFALRKPVGSALHDADVVLDTNVLLLPYRAGASSLKEIVAALTTVRDGGRLFVPGRVAREFARLRHAKLGELLQALSDQASRVVAPDEPAYPLLEDLAEYRVLAVAVKALQEARKEYTKAAGALRGRMLSWEGNDPVSTAYSQLFTSSCIRDPAVDKAEVLKELRRRVEHEIPPGYKDASKSDGGIGDLLIWLTILDLARERKKSLVFVTGEEKADWQHRSGGRGILPRFELVDEYRRASAGAEFYIIQMSELLELLQVGRSTVAEIEQEEQRTRELIVEHVVCPNCESAVDVELAQAIGSSALPRCRTCNARFHVHRGGDGVFTHEMGRGAARVEGRDEVIVECPYCAASVPVLIGKNHKDSAAPICSMCSERFHAHRAWDATVFTRRRGAQTTEAASERPAVARTASEAAFTTPVAE